MVQEIADTFLRVGYQISPVEIKMEALSVRFFLQHRRFFALSLTSRDMLRRPHWEVKTKWMLGRKVGCTRQVEPKQSR